MQPVVRLRFLVALVVLFGLLASAAGAVAVSKSREVDELTRLVEAQDRVHRVEWPEGYSRVSASGGCVSTARSMCLVADDDPAAVAGVVAKALGVSRTGTDDHTLDGSTRHLLGGHLGEQPVSVVVERDRPRGDAPGDAGAVTSVDVTLLTGD